MQMQKGPLCVDVWFDEAKKRHLPIFLNLLPKSKKQKKKKQLIYCNHLFFILCVCLSFFGPNKTTKEKEDECFYLFVPSSNSLALSTISTGGHLLEKVCCLQQCNLIILSKHNFL